MTLFRRSHIYAALAVLAVAALFSLAMVAVATAGQQSRAAAAGPKASVSVSKCRGAATYAERRLEFRASMSAMAGASKMELRYTLLRRYKNQARFRVVAPTPGNSLGEWLASSDSNATRYIHKLAVTPVETAADYRVKVAYRWVKSSGKVVKRAKRTSKLCKQRRGLPNLQIASVQRYPNGGPLFPELPVVWVVTVVNNGSSSAAFATSPILSGAANGGLTDGTVVTQPLDPQDTIPAGASLMRHLYGQECRNGQIEINADPLNVVRERNEKDNSYKVAC